MGTATAKERGKHQANNFAQQLFLAAQAAFDLGDQVIGQAHVVEGLVESVDIALSLSSLALMAFFGVQAASGDRFDVFFGVSFGRGHGVFLRIVG
jgi:hypothetical protein